MTNKIKAVIMRPDHNNDVLRLKSKKDPKMFSHKGCKYFIDSEHFQLTYEKKFFFWKKWFVTYYYRMGTTKPIPVPNFPGIKDLGISAEEMHSIFNPWLMKIIGTPPNQMKDRVMFWLAAGNLVVVIYLAWMMNRLPDQIAKALTGGG